MLTPSTCSSPLTFTSCLPDISWPPFAAAPSPLAGRGRRLLANGAAFLALGLGACGPAAAAWTDGQAATTVIGAADLTSVGGGTASASRFAGPTDVCTDAATGTVFVVNYNQHRILRFSAAEAAKAADGVAESVLGQPDFTSTALNNGGLSARSLNYPMTCAIDAAGNLFVTDAGNNRVLRYDNAASKASFADADGVLGQADFTSNAVGTTAARFGALGNLYGIALDPNGSLYVSDSGNRRVLRFDNAAGKANGAVADGVLGAPDFTAVGVGGATASTFSNQIYGLAVNAAGNLYVSDAGNRRILRFNNAAGKANGAAADGVLGAPNLGTAGAGTASPSNFSTLVYGIEVLADGALYAADFTFNRVLVFDQAATKPDGANADHVLGQANFTSTAAAVTAAGLASPVGLGYNVQTGSLMITNYGSHRVVGHYQAMPAPAPAPGGVASIPTLSQWGLIVLSAAMGFLALLLPPPAPCAPQRSAGPGGAGVRQLRHE